MGVSGRVRMFDSRDEADLAIADLGDNTLHVWPVFDGEHVLVVKRDRRSQDLHALTWSGEFEPLPEDHGR